MSGYVIASDMAIENALKIVELGVDLALVVCAFIWWFTTKETPPNPERWPIAQPGKLVAGDQVQLVSGGPIMTVERPGSDQAQCIYFTEAGKRACIETFAVAILRVKPSTRLFA